MKDEKFHLNLSHIELEAWTFFKEVLINFLGSNKNRDYENIESKMITNFENLEVIKVDHRLYNFLAHRPLR